MLARQRMIDACPKTEEEKYGEDKRMTYNYMTFRRKFNAITNVQGITLLDILNKIFCTVKLLSLCCYEGEYKLPKIFC